MALASDPGDSTTATVEISVESGPFDNAIYVSPDDLTFTGGASGNWSTPQTVTVTGRNDDDEFDDLPEIEHILKVGSKTGLGRNVEVTVIDGNRAPYFLEGTGTTRRVSEGAGQDDEVGDPVEALDLNASDTLTYSLEDTSGKFSIDSGTGQVTVAADGALDYETATVHEFNVIVKDDGGLSDKIDVTVLVRNVDEPLEVTGDATPTFNENANINNAVARYTARDPEGSPVSFAWSVEGTDGSDFSIDTGGNLKFSSQPDHETQDEYSIIIVATDTADSFNSGELTVTVTVTDVNEPPEIIGSGSEIYRENQANPVATFGFIDREGDDVAWTLAGTDRGDFTINSNGQLQFASTPDFERPVDSGSNNIYNLTVVATDDGTPPQVDRLDVTVTVEDVNETPSTPSGSASITEAENTTGNLARYTSSDPERRTIAWSITGTDAGSFRIDSSGNLAFDGAPDHENAGDSGRNNVYDIAVTASDDGNLADGTSSTQGRLSASFNVTVTVTPVDEPPVIGGASTFNNWQENDGGVIETYTATDPEGNTPITWTLGGTDRGDFTLTGGVLEFVNTPDHEAPTDSGGNNHYEVTVQATDSNNKRGQLHVDVIVKNVDEPPTIAGPETVDDFPENSPTSRQVARYTATDPEGATVALSLTGADSDEFTLAGNGVLAFKESPDYEAPGGQSYGVTVRAAAGSHTVDKPVAVNIQNTEETGAVTLSTVQPQVGTSLAATLEDDDEPSGVTWQWYLASSRSSAGTAISGETSDSYTPTSGDVGSYLRVVASYDDGFDTSNTAAAVSANRVQVRPPDPAPPVFGLDGDYQRTIRENTRASTNLGAPVTATDINNDKLTYSIDDTTNFEIVESTGQLRTRVELDHEEQASRSVVVTATDPDNTSDNVTVTITVENVDETPVVSGPATVDVAENAGTSVATYAATDPDDTGIDWILTGTDSGPFTLSGGVLTFNEVPDYEEKNNYRVTVEAHERSPGTSVARLSVAVRVTNVDEPGMVEANAESPRVGQALRLGVEDEDDGESVTEWKWERGDPNSPCGTGTNWQTIPGANGSSYTPTAAGQGKCLRVTAIYNDRAGTGNTVQYITAETVEFGPYFDSDTATASVPENSAEGRSVGQFRARHSNSGEALTYSLTGGDTGYFTIDDTGQLRTSATPLDYEGQPGPEAVAEITAEDNSGETATITVTVSVTDVCDSATSVPGRPAAPNVSAASSTSLRASWSPPSGPCIASFQLQYRQTGNTGWSSGGFTGTTRSRTITGLSASTTYEVQVRARNSEGPGGWSPTGTGTTSAGGGVGIGGSNEGGGSGDTGGSGGGGGGGFAFAGGGGGAPAPAQPRTVNNFQSPQQIFQPLVANGTLQRVWRFFALGQRWLFYDPRPSFLRFNTLRTVNLASDPPAILLVSSTRQQRFRGYALFEGWNFVPIEAESPAPRPGRNLQQLSQLLRPLVQNGTLERVWRLDPRTQGWELYDPDPAFASVNTLRTVDLNANPPVVLAVSVNRSTEFQGNPLYPGWNYILMR